MTRLPLTVIGGYLGAGKTTLINRLLSAEHGLKLTVFVNDFGAVNVDASLLKSASADTLALTNGCVCCALAGDLFQAVGDLLDRPDRPDHLLIEASGISDPAKIANLALAEPDLCYAGILTMLDATNFAAQRADSRIADQVLGQIDVADFVAVSKAGEGVPEILKSEPVLAGKTLISADEIDLIADLIFATRLNLRSPVDARRPHAAYQSHLIETPFPLAKAAIAARLNAAPQLLRLKGFLPSKDGGIWEVHLVGRHWDITPIKSAPFSGLVAIGLQEHLPSAGALDLWWRGVPERAIP